MRIIIVRHGDPNYEIDSLTEVGWEEARYVADRIAEMDVKDFYVSPLGRAQDTASCTLKKLGRTAITYDWLQEFPPTIARPDRKGQSICWDWLPQDWAQEERFYSVKDWLEVDAMKNSRVKQQYDKVCNSLDELLSSYGYVREKNYYRVEAANSDTIVFFCHFGVECVMLSRLLNVSPMILWHGFCAAPSSVTTVYTEERRKGIASWRVAEFGDTSHLYKAGKKPSFSARFCECYDNMDERHD